MVAGAAAAAVLLARLWGAWYPLLLPEILLGVAVMAAVAAALLWPLPDHAMATSADKRLSLRDRLATAVDLTLLPQASGMQQAMVNDALDHLQRLRPADAYPFRAYRSTRLLGLCLLVLLAAQLLPIPPLLLSPQQRQDKALLRKEAAEIEPLAKKLREEAQKTENAEALQLARKLRKLAQQLKRGKLDKKAALLSLKDMEKELEKLESRLAPPVRKTAQEAAEDLIKAERNRLAAQAQQLAKQAARQGDREMQKTLNELARKAKQAKQSTELQKLSDQLKQQAAKAGMQYRLPTNLPAALSQALSGQNWEGALANLDDLAEALEKLDGELSEEELQELAEQLDELAEALKDTDLAELSECLGEACECLQAGQCKKAGKCLAKGAKACKGKAAILKLAGECGKCKKCLGMCRGRCAGGRSGMGIGPDNGSQQSIPANAPGAGLYEPRTAETSGSAQRVRARVRPQGPMLTITEKSAPVVISGSQVPYYEVIEDYSKAAEEALAKEEVPPVYRKTVRDYFDALQGTREPDAAKGGSDE